MTCLRVVTRRDAAEVTNASTLPNAGESYPEKGLGDFHKFMAHILSSNVQQRPSLQC